MALPAATVEHLYASIQHIETLADVRTRSALTAQHA
jgi:hypothetical protein